MVETVSSDIIQTIKVCKTNGLRNVSEKKSLLVNGDYVDLFSSHLVSIKAINGKSNYSDMTRAFH